MGFLNLLWELANTPAGVTVIATLALVVLNKILDKRPGWAKYTGTLISAVKHAEKAIPDTSVNKAAARLDAALQYAIKVIEAAEKRRLSDKEEATLAEGLRVTHSDLEVRGVVPSGSATDGDPELPA